MGRYDGGMRCLPLLLLACAAEPTADTADTAPAEAAVRFTSVAWECEQSEWLYQASTEGWAVAVDVALFAVSEWDGGSNAGVYAEAHALERVAFAEDEAWTRWEIRLEPTTRALQEDGASTALVCEVDGPETWAFRAQLFVEDGRADCGIWGQRSADYFNTALVDDCHCFDAERGCGPW